MAQLTGTGTGDKRKLALAVTLGIVVLALAANTIFGGSPTSLPSVLGQSANVAAATVTSSARASRGAAIANTQIDPSLHPELMAENESYLYAGSGRNIFSQTSAPPPRSLAIEKVAAPVRPSQQLIAANTGPPPPPSIDLKFFGFAARENGSRRAFLTHGDDLLVASEGDVVSHRYRVVHIAPTSIDVEDLGYHHTQTLPLISN